MPRHTFEYFWTFFGDRVGFAIIFADLTPYSRKCEIRHPCHVAFRRWRISGAVLGKPTVFQVLIFSKYVSGVGVYRKLEIRTTLLFSKLHLFRFLAAVGILTT